MQLARVGRADGVGQVYDPGADAHESMGDRRDPLAFGFLYTAVSNVFSNAYHIYQAEIFPTPLRSTAASGTYSLSRLATAAMPFVLIPLLDHTGPTALFVVVALALVLVATDIGVLGPRTTGRTLDAPVDTVPRPADAVVSRQPLTE